MISLTFSKKKRKDYIVCLFMLVKCHVLGKEEEFFTILLFSRFRNICMYKLNERHQQKMGKFNKKKSA